MMSTAPALDQTTTTVHIAGMPSTLSHMEGTWRIVTAMESGQKVDQAGALLVITGDLFERRTSTHSFIRRVVVREERPTAEIDLHILNEPDQGKVLFGLLIVVGDEMQICHSLPGRARPLSFTSTAEDGQVLSYSRRVVP